MTAALDRKGMTPHKARWLWPLALVLAGTLQAVALAVPQTGQPQWWLQVLALSVLCAALQQSRSSRQAAWWGGLFATAWLSATFWWLFISMHTYGGLPAVLAVLAVLALAAFLGSYYALLMALWRRWSAAWLAGCGPVRRLLDAGRAGARHAVDRLSLGAIGYAHVDGPLSALPRWGRVWHWCGSSRAGHGAGAVARAGTAPQAGAGGSWCLWPIAWWCMVQPAAGAAAAGACSGGCGLVARQYSTG